MVIDYILSLFEFVTMSLETIIGDSVTNMVLFVIILILALFLFIMVVTKHYKDSDD